MSNHTLPQLAVFSNSDRTRKDPGKRDYGKVHGTRTLEEVHLAITGESLTSYTETARRLYAAAVISGPKKAKGDKTGKTAEWQAYDDHKGTAFGVTYAGTWKKGRRKTVNLGTHSSYVLTEADGDDPEEIKRALRNDPAVLLIYASTSGCGAHVIWQVSPVPTTNDEHRAAWAGCVARMQGHGVGTSTNDESVKDSTRLAYLAWDPGALLLCATDYVFWDRLDPESENEKTPVPHRYRTEHEVDLDALASIPCPRRSGDGKAYNSWLGWVTTLRSLRFSETEISRWCAGGAAGSCGNSNELASHPTPDLDTELDARNKLRGAAVNKGWVPPGRSRSKRKGNTAPRPGAPGSATRQPILACLPSQDQYPVPDVLRCEVQAIHEVSGGGIPMCALATLGAYNLLADHDYDVKALARNPHPISLFGLVSAQSGSRKSTVVDLAYAGHEAADDRITRAHEDVVKARAEFDLLSKGKVKVKGNAKGPQPARAFVPRALKADFTVQAAIKLLATGRPTQAAVMGEAGRLIGQGSWSFGKDQADKSLLDLADIWTNGTLNITRVKDNVDVKLTGRRFGMMLMAQWAKADPFLLSPAAADGFAARVLYARQDERLPEVRCMQWDDPEGAEACLNAMRDLIFEVRYGQDDGLEFAPDHGGDGRAGPREIVYFDADGLGLLRAFGEETLARADMDVTLHEESYWVRAPEQAARIGATLATVAHYKGEVQQPVITGAIARDAIAMARWHGDELARLVAGGAGAQLAGAARWVADRLDEAGRGDCGRASPDQSGGTQIKVLSYITKYAAGAASHIKKDTDARKAVVSVLEEYHWVAPASERGWHDILR